MTPIPPETPRRWARLAALAVAALAAAAIVAGCEKKTTEPEPPPVPTVTGYDQSTVLTGDTLVIAGADFLTPESMNQVRFANPAAVATPFAATTDTLRVVVHQNATTGPVSVTVEGQPVAGVGPALTISDNVRGVAEVWVYGGISEPNALTLPYPTGSAEYLVIPHATNPSRPYNEIYAYSVATTDVAPSPAPAPAGVAGTMTIREAFERHRHEEAQALGARVKVRPEAAFAPRSAAAPQQEPQFYVLKTTTGSTALPSSYQQVTAELRHTGAFCLIYTDVDTLSSGNLTHAHLKNIADVFDAQIRPSNATHFGTESDVDGNGKVIILVTPVVNRLTPPSSSGFIAGFFLSIDLYAPGQGGVLAGTTNHAEIFYLLAADPSATWGNKHETADVADENIRTTAHEYEHLISFSHRLFQQGSTFQITWLEEGMAHMAEDLLGWNQSNVNRANLYLADPGGMTLEHNWAPLEQRGGIYLFLRYLGDRFGTAIYKSILQSRCVGRPCIEAITGEDFYQTVADFLATLYLSGKGINATNKYNYQSIDLNNFTAVPIASHDVGDPAVNGTVWRAGGDFYLFANPTTSTGRFVFDASANARLRAVIVRTQ
jgi:hypothetical protein